MSEYPTQATADALAALLDDQIYTCISVQMCRGAAMKADCYCERTQKELRKHEESISGI